MIYVIAGAGMAVTLIWVAVVVRANKRERGV